MSDLTINIPEEFSNYLESLHYDYTMKKDVIETMLENHAADTEDGAKMVLNSAIFNMYQKQCSDAYAAYQIGKDKLTEQFIPDDVKDKRYSWSMDFNTHTLLIHVSE